MPSIIYTQSANTVEAPTYQQLSDTAMLAREVIKNTIADTFDQSPFLSMLQLMSKGRTSVSKKPEWIVGDQEAVRTTLGGAINITNSSKGQTYTITLTATTVPIGSLLYMVDTADTPDLRAIFKYAGQGQAGTLIYASTTAQLDTASTTVYILPTSMYYDGEAGLGVNYGGLFYRNMMQRVRESVERGPHTESDNMYMKRDLPEIARIKYLALQRQLEQQLATSNTVGGLDSVFTREGIMGGVDYFLRPDVTGSMYDILGVQSTDANEAASSVYRGVGVRGWTKLISGSTIDFDTCEEIMADARAYGSDARHIFCSPAVARKFTKMARNEKALFAADYTFPNFPNIIAKIPAFETAFGTIYIHADYSMSGIYKHVVNASQYIDGTEWAYVLDMGQFDWITHDVPGKGVQTLKLKEVDLNYNNNTVQKAEWDGTFTLACFEPRACGTIAFGTPV